MEASPHTLRFRGNRGNPNFPAVRHLLQVYAAHLGAGFKTVGDEAAANIYWDVSFAAETFPEGEPCIVVPGRPSADPELRFDWTRDGFPVPRSGQPGRGVARGEILDAAGIHALFRAGSAYVAEWDVFSLCADMLFKRADGLPAYRDASREGRFRDLPDAELRLDQEPWADRWMFRMLGLLPEYRPAVKALPSRARIWLTHDLDNLAKWRPRSVAGQLLRTPAHLAAGRFGRLRRNYAEIFARIFAGRDPFDTVDAIIGIEREAGRKSAYFFLANGRDHLFHRYDLALPRFLRVLKACQAAGGDIGLHGQVRFIADAAGMLREKVKLEALAGMPIRLNRQHYLRWDVNHTNAFLAECGVSVDATLGYNDTPGFRCGTAWPYPWFDSASGRASRLLIVPLILGEFQFYDPRKFDAEEVAGIMESYLERTCRQGGVFTVLFHNEYFYERDFPGHGSVYRDLLRRAASRKLPDFDPLDTHGRYARIIAESDA